MNHAEAHALLTFCFAAHHQAVPEHEATIWAALLDDADYGLCVRAARNIIRRSDWVPKVSEILAETRSIRREDERQRAMRHLPAARATTTRHTRTGANMCAHVLGALRDAGQDIRDGQFLGTDRAADIAETACRQWLARTLPPVAVDQVMERTAR